MFACLETCVDGLLNAGLPACEVRDLQVGVPVWARYDAFYDRGRTISLNNFRNDGPPSTQNRPNFNLVSGNEVIVSLGHGIIHRDPI